MTQTVIRMYDPSGDHVDLLCLLNPDGKTYSFAMAPIDIRSDLKIGAKSLALTLSSGVGSVPIPDTATLVGVKPVSSTSIRVGLEAPESDGSKTGTAVSSDLKKGVPVDATVWTWFNIGVGTSRVLYVKGGTSDVVEVSVM
jgi:hypothetical protein